jgi:hypothetical protein
VSPDQPLGFVMVGAKDFCVSEQKVSRQQRGDIVALSSLYVSPMPRMSPGARQVQGGTQKMCCMSDKNNIPLLWFPDLMIPTASVHCTPALPQLPLTTTTITSHLLLIL